jgi:hypothetical protein
MPGQEQCWFGLRATQVLSISSSRHNRTQHTLVWEDEASSGSSSSSSNGGGGGGSSSSSSSGSSSSGGGSSSSSGSGCRRRELLGNDPKRFSKQTIPDIRFY